MCEWAVWSVLLGRIEATSKVGFVVESDGIGADLAGTEEAALPWGELICAGRVGAARAKPATTRHKRTETAFGFKRPFCLRGQSLHAETTILCSGGVVQAA